MNHPKHFHYKTKSQGWEAAQWQSPCLAGPALDQAIPLVRLWKLCPSMRASRGAVWPILRADHESKAPDSTFFSANGELVSKKFSPHRPVPEVLGNGLFSVSGFSWLLLGQSSPGTGGRRVAEKEEATSPVEATQPEDWRPCQSCGTRERQRRQLGSSFCGGQPVRPIPPCRKFDIKQIVCTLLTTLFHFAVFLSFYFCSFLSLLALSL